MRTFNFTTAMSPYKVEEIGTASRLAQTMNGERKALFAKARRLLSGLLSRGWDSGRSGTPFVTLIIGENHQALAAAYLRTHGFAVQAVRPPTVPHGSARLQFSLTSGISNDELVRLESPLNSWREQESWSAAVARA